MRAAFDKDELKKVLDAVGRRISRRMKVFLLGGGAMAFRGQKIATKDLDLVFDSLRDCRAFSKEIASLGFTQKHAISPAYSNMGAAGGIWQDAGGFRFDLFVGTVCNALKLSPGVKKRSTLLRSFGKLDVMIASNEDVILFKSITERQGDSNDIAAIVLSARVDWETVLAECRAQSGKRLWYGSLVDKFSDLKERHGIDVPIAGQVEKLYEQSSIRESYKIKRKKGMTGKQALAQLKQDGFTAKELKQAGVI